MRPYTAKEKAKITAGAVAALVMTGMFFVLALAFLQRRREAAKACRGSGAPGAEQEKSQSNATPIRLSLRQTMWHGRLTCAL
jgi:hypothetical protein